MKKPLVALLALGLVAGALVGPVHAKKKPKKPKPPVAAPVQADQKYYLVNSNASGCAAEGMLLMLAPAEAGGSCGSYFGGPVNTALSTATNDVCTPVEVPTQGILCGRISYAAGEGLPVVVDATKKITGTIFVSSYRGAAQNPGGLSAGPTTFNMALNGTLNGELKEIGKFSASYTVTPDKQIYEVPFEIALDPALDKAELTTLAVDFWNTGAAAMHGFYNVNTSNIVLPVWKTL